MSNFKTINNSIGNMLDEGGVESITMEAYYGRSKELKQIESEFNAIIKEVRKVYTDNMSVSGYHDMLQKIIVSNDVKPHIAKIETLFKKQFGFNDFNLIYASVEGISDPNAFAVPSGIIRRTIAHDGMFNIVPLKQQSGGYYDKTHTYTCTVMITPGMFDVMDLTGAEMLALVLHEIGHNFQCTPLANIGWFLPFLDLFEINFDAGQKAKVAKNPAFIRFINYILDNELSNEWYAFKTKFGNLLYEIFSSAIKPIIMLTDMIGKALNNIKWMYVQMMPFLLGTLSIVGAAMSIRKMNPATLLNVFCGYSGEVFADSFAVAYGYGPELSSAMSKLGAHYEMSYNLLMDNPVLGPLYELNIVTFEIIQDIFNLDPHPSNQRRIMNMMEKLEREINSGKLPPALKKSAMEDLKKNRRIYQKFLNAEVGDKQFALIASYRTLNDSLFGGKLDVKHTINKIVNLGNYEA